VWTDSHCHVPYEGVATGVIDDARAAGVGRLITVGTDAAQSSAALEVARIYDGVWATAGLHPHDASLGLDEVVKVLDGAGPELVAVGECGLDYHYDHSPRPVQRQVFADQIALARDRDLTLVIHTREAWDDTFAILSSGGAPERVVFHCFTGGPDEARRALNLGAWVSFSGIVTFPSAPEVRAAAALVPAERLLVETDSPFLAPVPHRGRPNRPALVAVVGAAVAAARGETVEVVEESTTAAAVEAFRLPPAAGGGGALAWRPGSPPG
jgi:TatD DNase family protein